MILSVQFRLALALFLFSFLSSLLSPYYVCAAPADRDTLKIEIESEKQRITSLFPVSQISTDGHKQEVQSHQNSLLGHACPGKEEMWSLHVLQDKLGAQIRKAYEAP